MSKEIRLKEAIDNAEAYILFLASLPDKELSKRLDLIHLQMELAEQKRNTDSLELLEVWRSQVIEARIYKAENEIADALNEIALTIADIETVVIQTKKIPGPSESILVAHRTFKPRNKDGDQNQMSLF